MKTKEQMIEDEKKSLDFYLSKEAQDKFTPEQLSNLISISLDIINLLNK